MDQIDGTLRIAMLGHKHIPSREGGVEVVVEELSSRMALRGHRVTCYNRGGHHNCGEFFNAEKRRIYKGIRLKTVPTIPCKGLAAASASFFAAITAAVGRFDVIHFHAEGSCAVLWIPKLLGKRCVATIHGLDWQREKWKNSLGSWYIRLGEKIAVKYADEIIVLSRSAQVYFQKTYGRETYYIPNGVNPPVIRPPSQITEKFGLRKDGYLLFVGRIVPEKGLRCLIEAYQSVDTQKKLVIAGGASDTKGFFGEMKMLAQKDGRILFTDFVSGTVLEELYSNAYLYVLPSDLEGMSLSLLEAMSYGNCCVVSDIPECREVVGDNAVRFPKGDAMALQNTLQMLCDDENLAQKYKKSAADVLSRYCWDDITERTIARYGRGYCLQKKKVRI